MGSTMPESGIHVQNYDSARRYLETRNATPSPEITMRAATITQILEADIKAEEQECPSWVILAKQGLYDIDRRDNPFHPSDLPEYEKKGELFSDGTYVISRQYHTHLLSLLKTGAATLRGNESLMTTNATMEMAN